MAHQSLRDYAAIMQALHYYQQPEAGLSPLEMTNKVIVDYQ